jgi:glutamate-ammonia-ligase adenylyltransferase
MDFAARITRHPIPYAPDRGAEALACLPGLAPELRPLIAGAAGCSPYLCRLIAQEAAWLAPVLHGAPEDAMATLLAAAAAAQADTLNPDLRRIKRQGAILVALADLGGVWDLMTVTGAWTDLADACLQAATRAHVAVEAKRGKLPGMTEDDALTDACGMVMLAMGKMGAGELNYSSDIDLICLFDEGRFDGPDEGEARTAFIRATRRIAASLGENTADGYVFRTDLRLRPDASVTPVCLSMASAERYYEAEGRPWERSAYIKARPAAGDLVAGARFLKTLEPFVWRRHLDFATITDTHDMRQRIRDHKGLHGIRLDGHNMKLGAGGIRDIEFFAQTRQLVAGGRDVDLRQRQTLAALRVLARKDWITDAVAANLSDHYTHHREVEHRLQMIADAQTHMLPNTPEGFDRLARFMGQGDTAAFRAALHDRLAAVAALTETFFAPDTRLTATPDLSDAAQDIVARWPGYPALRSVRGQQIFERLKPDLLARFQKAAKPDEALAHFDGFLRGLPAGVQLFSLFEANPQLVDLIVDICATAPGLSRYLARNSTVLDAVLDGQFFAPWPGRAGLERIMAGALAGQDYERQLDAARVVMKEWHFRIGVHHLRGLIGAAEAGGQYSDLAAAVVAALWPLVCADIARRHGPAPGRGGAVVGMGSLGAGRMTAGSDLDLLVIYDAGGVEMTKGRRPLDPRGWFAKATKALITALTVPTAQGALYEVDLRLRPSGRQGPVATALEAFRIYQRDEAWTWEHMALTRARVLVGEASLCADIDAVRADVIAGAVAPAMIRTDAADMRVRLAAAGRAGATFAVKDGPGGMQEIDLLAQAMALMAHAPVRETAAQLTAGRDAGALAADDAATLIAAHMLFAQVNQAVRLLSDRVLDLNEIGAGGRAFLAKAADVADVTALAAKLDDLRSHAAKIIIVQLPAPKQENTS